MPKASFESILMLPSPAQVTSQEFVQAILGQDKFSKLLAVSLMNLFA